MNKKFHTPVFILLLIVAVLITYSNHFYNSFHFDDYHTIVNNIYIRDIGNFANFFTDIKTFSAMANNLGYRPVVTASTAIDFWIGGGYYPFYFHLSMFFVFLLQGVFMFFMFLKIFNISYKHDWTKYLVFFSVGWYMLHPGNAETINYIIARSDSFSTFFVILAFVCYMFSDFCKKYYLYLIPLVLGGLSKETAAMFPLLLFVYILLFENKVSLTTMFSSQRKQFFNAVLKTFPAFIIALAVTFLVQYICFKNTTTSGIINAGMDVRHVMYILTQPYVLFTYFCNFFLPVSLSSDPDFAVFSGFSDFRMYLGFLFVIGMFILAFITSKNEKQRPIAFGILWFFIAAIPTSILAALTQASNSHRLFFLYVGLSIAAGWGIWLLLLKFKSVFEKPVVTKSIITVASIILCAYAFATYQRNEVWKNDETLWSDILEKSPKNPRALMNYGLELMKKGDYSNAESYFLHSVELWPNFNYAYVNLGILKGATGDKISAENYFKKAIQYGDNSFPSYYYGKFLYDQMRYKEAIVLLSKSISISPSNIDPRILLMRTYYKIQDWEKLKILAENTIKITPGDKEILAYLQACINKKGEIEMAEEEIKKTPTPEKYLNLSLLYYQKEKYEKCIEAAQNALKLKPLYPDAYNNIGSAYNMLKQYDLSISACQKAIKLDPKNQLAKNNLALAIKNKNEITQAEELIKIKPNAENYLNLSLIYYQHEFYDKCIETCFKAIKLKPDYADAYNNLCASYNQLQQWDKAAEACRKALKINPNHKLAAGNLKWATNKK